MHKSYGIKKKQTAPCGAVKPYVYLFPCTCVKNA